MLWILQLIPGLFTTVNGITNAISNERLKLIDAKTDQARITSQERINSLQAKRDVLIAESGGSRINSFIRASTSFTKQQLTPQGLLNLDL